MEELTKLKERILALSDKQIWELYGRVRIDWGDVPMEQIVSEIRENETDSMNLDILVDEASSKEELLKGIENYEKAK